MFKLLIHMLGIESHDLVVETDENSHWFYLCADERAKEKDVHYWISKRKRPLIWIRFNPDAYDDPVTGERVTSCFGIGKDGVCRPKPSKSAEWKARLTKLGQVIDEFLVDHTEAWAKLDAELRPAPDAFVPIELFYDNVTVKRGEAAAAFAGIKAAAAGKKRARE